MIGEDLNNIFKEALHLAKENRHEFLTIEHVFLAILSNKEGEKIFKNIGVNIAKMKEKIVMHLKNSIKSYPPYIIKEPFETIALSRVIDEMIRHAQNAEKKEANLADLLSAIISEEHSFSVKFLKTQGIEKVDILEAITELQDDSKKKDETKENFLSRFAQELVKKAKSGEIDPVIGREKEIERIIQVLCRRKKNNPLLVGEPGVGKTAIIEGLALKIAKAEVPEVLRKKRIFSLDMGLLLAGTKFRGDFEKRLKKVIDEIKINNNNIIFIDEIHTIVGAGSTQNGSMDASNILKPALVNGDVRCIGATTYLEHRNYIEKDKALSRRFAKVEIKEPDAKTTFKILEGLKTKYEKYHNVRYSLSSLKRAIELSERYIGDRFLPDKAIDIIDEAGAYFKVKKQRRKVIGHNDIEEVVGRMLYLTNKRISKNEIEVIKNLEENLSKKILGQEEAINKVVSAIKRSKAGLAPPNKPVGSFLFIGPTGVGKTELAKEIANALSLHFERFDMSEYMEKHAVSRLIGAPPGYVGYEEGGLLTEAIRKNPYSLLLLDEIEKAHYDLINILLQVMDNAKLTDNVGNIADFTNVIIVMTSNAGTTNPETIGFKKSIETKFEEGIKSFFSPEFRNRLDEIIYFNSLSIDVMEKIVENQIEELNRQLLHRKISVYLTKRAKKYLAKKGYCAELGARPLQRVISKEIKTPLTEEILFGKLCNGGIVRVDTKNSKLTFTIR